MGSTLYERLGGEEGLKAIVHDVIELHLKNPAVNKRYEGKDKGELNRLAFEFFAMGTGGPQKYTGRSMLETHKGMNISEQEFLAVIDDILESLDMHKIAQETKTEVLGILYSMKGEIVRV